MSDNIITIALTLYRYDLKIPPNEWDPNFVSDEYKTEEFGHKNQAGLFFFTSSLDIAKSLGEAAAKKQEKDAYYFTTTSTTSPLKLIDITRHPNMYTMVKALMELGIDVLTEDFKTFEDSNHFGQLRPTYESAEAESDVIRKSVYIHRIRAHSANAGSHPSLFGQRLTDFSNGHIFKSLAKSIIEGVDGYCFTEYQDDRGYTCCLFDSSKLSTIEREIVTI